MEVEAAMTSPGPATIPSPGSCRVNIRPASRPEYQVNSCCAFPVLQQVRGELLAPWQQTAAAGAHRAGPTVLTTQLWLHSLSHLPHGESGDQVAEYRRLYIMLSSSGALSCP
jgi:hypothetical protein